MINDDSIKQLNLIELNINHTSKITNINHMTDLKKLSIYNNKGINDNSIKNLNLFELNASNSPNITNVNHMTYLKILDASFDCGLDDNGIKNLNFNLIILNNSGNPKITFQQINRMTNLKMLNECAIFGSPLSLSRDN